MIIPTGMERRQWENVSRATFKSEKGKYKRNGMVKVVLCCKASGTHARGT